MKRIFSLLLAIIGIIAMVSLLGCAAGDNTLMQNTFLNNTTVTLSENNFRVVGAVTGKNSNCLLNDGFPEGEAIKDMFEKAKLTGSQTIINVVTMRESGPLCDEVKAYGTIIEFIDKSVTNKAIKYVDIESTQKVDKFLEKDSINNMVD